MDLTLVELKLSCRPTLIEMSSETLAALSAKAPAWKALGLHAKAELVGEIIRAVQGLEVDGHLQCSKESAMTQCLDPGEMNGISVILEALTNIAVIKGHLERLRATLLGMARGDRELPSSVSARSRKTAEGEAGGGPAGEDQAVMKVFPINSMDRFGMQGKWTAELWMEPGCASPSSRGEKMLASAGGVAVVLGAGNQGFLTVVDMLDCLFVHQECVLVKHHPLRNYQDKFIRKMFEPLISKGFVDTVMHSTTEAAAEIVSHKLVTHVHMTGGKATHDAIVWGFPPPSPQERIVPVLKAKMTSELGCVTPWIVCPAEFSDAELQHQAGHLATVITANCSCNCNAPKAVLLSSAWKQKDRFVSLVKDMLRRLPAGVPYYPGTAKRYDAFQKHYPAPASCTIQPNEDVQPHIRCSSAQCGDRDLEFLCIDLKVDSEGVPLSSEDGGSYCLENEAFAPIIAFVTVGTKETEPKSNLNPVKVFMQNAANICNDKIFGSLSCTVVVHPTIEANHPEAVEQLIANLRYGVVSVNAWTALSYALDTCTWGAFPGEDPADIESGVGTVRNTLLFDHVQKTVVKSPLVDKAHLKFDDFDPDIAPILYHVTKLVLKPNCAACCGLCGAGAAYLTSTKCCLLGTFVVVMITVLIIVFVMFVQ